MIIQSKTYGLTNNFNQLKLKCQNNELLQFYRTMKSCRQRIRRKAHSSGFIDIHDHGWHGGDANHANHEFIKEWQAYLQKKGLQLLPTTSTTFPKDLEHSFEVIGSFIEEDQGTNGAQILGIHAKDQ